MLPGAFPNLLANGSSGIAVGMATNIPPHNAAELCDAALHLIKFPNAAARQAGRTSCPGPDFPTGGIIVEPRERSCEAYKTGRGSFRVRARWTKEDIGPRHLDRRRHRDPLPDPEGAAGRRIAELLRQRKLPLLADVRDEMRRRQSALVLEPQSRTRRSRRC